LFVLGWPVMRGKSGVSGLSGGISSDHELGEYLRLLLHAAVEPIELTDGGLKRIRARLALRPRRAVGGLACRRPAEVPARRRPRCR
jgi:hypothetical protein